MLRMSVKKSIFYVTWSACILLMLCSLTEQEGIVVEVVESKVIHCSSGCCKQGNGYFLCSSMDQLNSFVKGNSTSSVVEIRIVCTNCALSGLITFNNVSGLFIYGKDEVARIHCKFHNVYGAGFVFKHSTNLTLSNLTFIGCGGLQNSTSNNVSADSAVLQFKTAVYFENCFNINVSQVVINQSCGIGLVFYDSRGWIIIESCTFESNLVPDSEKSFPGGGGMYIEFTPCFPRVYQTRNCDRNSVFNMGGWYIIQNCNFTHNRAHSLRSYLRRSGFRTFGQGGGLLISLRGNASGNNFTIKDCLFTNNHALWGGGLHLLVTDSSKGNNITVSGTHFENNVANDGGGALAIYISSSRNRKKAPLRENLIRFERCNLTNNHANQGGGMIIFVSIGYTKSHKSNRLEFFSSRWTANTANSSAAVDVTTRDVASMVQGPFPTFTDCEFRHNKVMSTTRTLDGGHATQNNYGKASFMVTQSKVLFSVSVVFYGNNATALHVSAGIVSFCENMVANFKKNYGVWGGAIALIASSYLEVMQNSSFYFTSNCAYVKGGAIYSYSIGEHELHDHILSLGCFIQYSYGSSNSNSFSVVDRNLKFVFKENRVII